MKYKNYQYLLRLYFLVDGYLSESSDRRENLPEVVVAFCILIERLFKIKLHTENPILVYDVSKLKEDDALICVIQGKEDGIETIKIWETLKRYTLVFRGQFSEAEMQIFSDLHNVRNNLVHGYKSDDIVLSDEENLVKKMGTVWEKVSVQMRSLFGESRIKKNRPKKRYSEEELERVLIEEVRTKIRSNRNEYGIVLGTMRSMGSFTSAFGYDGEMCPRCQSYGFSLDGSNSKFLSAIDTNTYFYPPTSSDLYKCRNCNLELTKKEYDIAKKIGK